MNWTTCTTVLRLLGTYFSEQIELRHYALLTPYTVSIGFVQYIYRLRNYCNNIYRRCIYKNKKITIFIEHWRYSWSGFYYCTCKGYIAQYPSSLYVIFLLVVKPAQLNSEMVVYSSLPPTPPKKNIYVYIQWVFGVVHDVRDSNRLLT